MKNKAVHSLLALLAVVTISGCEDKSTLNGQKGYYVDDPVANI